MTLLPETFLVFFFIIIFSAAYNLFLYSYSHHESGVYSFSGGKIWYFLLNLHWFPLNLLILKSDICMFWL